MNLKKIIDNLEIDLKKGLVSPGVILNSLRVIDESSRKSGSYVDPFYMPFYYHLGKYIFPKNYIHMGLNLGLIPACFFRSCKTTENLLLYQNESSSFYSSRISLKNIKNNYSGNIDFHHGLVHDDIFENKIKSKNWDLVIVDERLPYDTHLSHLETLWPSIESNGLLIVDNVISDNHVKDSFDNFCNIKNRVPFIIKTRYGVGIVQK